MLRILPNGDVYVAIVEGGSRNQFTWAFRGRIFDFIPFLILLIFLWVAVIFPKCLK